MMREVMMPWMLEVMLVYGGLEMVLIEIMLQLVSLIANRVLVTMSVLNMVI